MIYIRFMNRFVFTFFFSLICKNNKNILLKNLPHKEKPGKMNENLVKKLLFYLL